MGRHKTSGSKPHYSKEEDIPNNQGAFFSVINSSNRYGACNNSSRRSRSRSSQADESSGSPISGSSGSDGMGITQREKRAKSVTNEVKKRDRNFRSSSVVSASESDQIRKTSSSSVPQYKFREMYTNGAYETSSELEDISGDSANSSPNNRVAHLDESAARSNGAVVSKQSKTSKQIKTSQTKHILNTDDDHHAKRNHGDHRHSSRPH